MYLTILVSVFYYVVNLTYFKDNLNCICINITAKSIQKKSNICMCIVDNVSFDVIKTFLHTK